jgi:hypothetical protein
LIEIQNQNLPKIKRKYFYIVSFCHNLTFSRVFSVGYLEKKSGLGATLRAARSNLAALHQAVCRSVLASVR